MTEDTKDRAAKLARIRALMAKTVDNGCTEAEANSAAAAVDRLLAAYEIDLDEVTMKQLEIVQLSVLVDGHDVQSGCLAIAKFCDCRVWTHMHGKFVVYFGYKVDTEIAEYLTQIFRRSMDREAVSYTVFNQEYEEMGAGGRHDMLTSFRLGMATRLGERLTEMKSKRDFTRRTTGTDLVLIKMPMVNSAYDALGLKLGRGRAFSGGRNSEAFAAGGKAAAHVQFNAGVAGRANIGGRIK